MTLDYTPYEVPIKNPKERLRDIKQLKYFISRYTEKQKVQVLAECELVTLRSAESRLYELSNLWRTANTPKYPVLQLVAQALGGYISVDVTADASGRVPAYHHITEEDDFLSIPTVQDHTGPDGDVRAFMNCPYSAPHKFLYKLCKEYEAGHIDRAVILCKQGAVSNQKSGPFLDNYASAVCHWGSGKSNPLDGSTITRMPFIDVDGFLVCVTNFDVSLYCLGEPSNFIEAFLPYGSVWIPCI